MSRPTVAQRIGHIERKQARSSMTQETQGCPVQPGKSNTPLRCLVLFAFALAVALISPAPTRADDSLKENTSLAFVPDDVGFYSAGLRGKEQLQALIGSRAFAKFQTLSYFKLGLAQWHAQQEAPFSPASQFNEWIDQPGNMDLLRTLGDMFSNEVFMFGDRRWAGVMEFMWKLDAENRFGRLQAQLSGDGGGDIEAVRQMILILNENRDELQVPGLLVGFKLTDTARAEQQLEQLAGLLELILASQPELADRFDRVTIDGGDFLSIQLDGSLIPWDEVPIADLEEVEGEFDELVEYLTELSVTVHLGIRDDYLLLSVAPGSELVKKAAGGKSLYDRDEFAPLRKHADERISGVSYLSSDLARQLDRGGQQIDSLFDILEEAAPMFGLDEKTTAELISDSEKFKKSLKSYLPVPGAQVGFSFLTDRGQEGYAYNWGGTSYLDTSKPLSLLKHVGASPFAYFVGRSKTDLEQYDLNVEIAKKAIHYGNAVAEIQLEGDELDQYVEIRDLALPFLTRLNDVTRTKFIPAFMDGQAALVLDARISSKQWIAFVPGTEKALPMLEPAIVLAVSDADLLKQAMKDYFTIAQDVVNALHELAPDDFPSFFIPPTAAVESESGTLYSFPALALLGLGLDSQLMPNAGLSDSVAVLSASPAQTERILKQQPLANADGPLAARDKPLGSATMFDWPAFVTAVEPWVEYGVTLSAAAGALPLVEEELDSPAEEGDPDDSDGEENDLEEVETLSTEQLIDDIRATAEILKCFLGFSAVQYTEGEAQVTHFESRWHDLPEPAESE